MRAIVQDRYGSSDVLELRDIATPAPGAGEALVAVRAAGLDQGVWHLMEGVPYPVRLAGYGLRAPKNPVPGSDLAGVVEAVGPGVTRLRPGDEVFGIGMGTFAEFARAREDRLAPRPARLTFVQAAAVAVSGTAALQAVRDHGRVRPGQRVLVVGASGGVGTYAVQLARAFGAEVTGVCRTEKVDLVRSLGADRVIDYTREDFAEATPPHDVILDVGGNASLSRLRRALDPAGDPRHRGRRDRRPLARWHRPSGPGAALVAVRAPEADHVHRPGEPGGSGRARGPDRDGRRHAGDRPDLPARRGARRHPPPERGARPRQGRHHAVTPQSGGGRIPASSRWSEPGRRIQWYQRP